VASYSAVIDVRVQGQQDITAVTDGVRRLEDLIRKVKPVPNLFDRRATEEVKELKRGLENLVKAFADGNTRIAKFSSSIAGVNQQLATFNSIAANAKVGSEQFTNALTAAAKASGNLLTKELERFSTLQKIYQRQAVGNLSIADQGPSQIVRDLIALKDTVPNSVSALERYQRELLDVQNVVSKTSLEYRQLEQAIRQVDVALGRGGQLGPAEPPVQGPRLPGNLGGGMNLPPGMPRMGKPPAAPAAKGMQGMLQKPGVADALIGGSFPLLFGGGPGATIGGALGGLAGGAMGSPLGMALSLALSAVGQQLDAAIAKVFEMQKALDALDIDKLRDSFVYVNAQLDFTVQKLIEAGKFEEARAVAAEEVARQTGASVSAIKESANATALLQSSWTEFTGAVSTLVSLLGAPIAAALAGMLKGLTLVVQTINTIISSIRDRLNSAFASFIRLIPGGDQLLKNMAKTFNIITEEEQKLIAQLKLANATIERQIVLNTQLLGLQKQITLGRTQAEKEINAAVNAQIAQKQINADFDIKAIELRKQYAGITDEAGKKELEQALLNNEAKRAQAIEEQKIKDLLAQQALELEANAQKYEAVRQSINLQVEALDRANSVRQSALSLQSALNDLYGAQLEREYRLATTSEQRLQIALKQFQQQVNAAKIEYEQATLNNKLLVDKAYLQTQLIKLRYEELAAEKEIAIAQATARGNTEEQIAKIAAGYDKALGVQEQIVAAAEDQLGSTIEIAANQDGIAEAVYKTKVLSAEAALAQKLSSEEIGLSKTQADELATRMSVVAQNAIESESAVQNLNTAIENGKKQTKLMASAMWGVKDAAVQAAIAIGKAIDKQLILNKVRGSGPTTAAEGAFWPGGFKAFAQGGVVNRPTMGLIGEGGESEYIVPESKAAGFATNYLFGQRGAAAIPDAGNTDGSAGTPVINITTGPVVEFDGQRYVTLADMERAMRITADSVIGKLRTPGSRIALGIS
jgi:hypothetical protein